jgi:hypothetical protein
MVKLPIQILLACALAWLLAQTAKVILLAWKQKTFKASWFAKQGRMPSSHSAVLAALSLALLLQEGISSLSVASLVLSVAIIRHLVHKGPEGHTFPEVLVGIAIGFLCAVFITQLL